MKFVVTADWHGRVDWGGKDLHSPFSRFAALVSRALKRAHRRAECSLLMAERMAALAELWAERPIPGERLRNLWHDVCFNQFHDILCGCSIKEAQDEAIISLGRAILGGSQIADTAGRAIASRVATDGPGGVVVLFNPFPVGFTGGAGITAALAAGVLRRLAGWPGWGTTARRSRCWT